MNNYLCVDGGTTNTRVSLTQGTTVLDTVRIPLGARVGMEGTAPLKKALKQAFEELLERFSLSEAHITRILASGMITSEFGLCALPHLPTPAGIAELHEAMHETLLSEISSIPFVFLRGVKTAGDTLLENDMMRGEETELYGLTDELGADRLYVLPGSHSKLITTDERGRIVHFSTMLTGEMIASLSGGTILKDAVDLSIGELDEAALTDGCKYALQQGLNEALFKVRILKNQFQKSPLICYSFFLGAILACEIQAILKSPAKEIVIGGKAQIKRATEVLLRTLSDKRITVASDCTVDGSSTRGAIRIFEFKTQE
ncbi:MAG: hypothetical protein E7643_04635 [Ruminococcaceae bacterium]|nr:hypothetical protein [Oscillospiraceae bacterium]